MAQLAPPRDNQKISRRDALQCLGRDAKARLWIYQPSKAIRPARVRGGPAERQAWGVEQMKIAAKASRRLGVKAVRCFTGSLAWP